MILLKIVIPTFGKNLEAELFLFYSCLEVNTDAKTEGAAATVVEAVKNTSVHNKPNERVYSMTIPISAS